MALTREPRGRGPIGTTLVAAWRLVDGLRRVVANLLVLLLLAGLVAAWWASRPPSLKSATVLVLALDGTVAEQRGSGGRQALLQRVQGPSSHPVALRDVVEALDRAARDRDIDSVLLQLDGFAGAGLPMQRELAAAITRFRASGKKVVAWGMSYSQRAYYLAAHADEVYLHPMGSVLIEGYGRQRNYYRDALDRLGISANVVRAGAFKNAAEPFAANAPSPQTLEAEGLVYQALWSLYQQGVEKARRLPPGHVQRMIDHLPQLLLAAQGDPARLALEMKLVDGLMTPDALRTLLIERGARDDRTNSFRQVSLQAYARHASPPREGDGVAVVVAEGEIVDGDAPAGRVGGRTVAELLRQAREDEQAKAIVLRVNSPGGSATASELIRRELQLARAAGKPVVVSMGDVATSGGYWVGLAADEVIADPGTITGSIGVVGLLPTAPGLMDKLSVRTGGTGTTWLIGAYDPRLPLDPRFEQLVQSAVDHLYADFTAKAAAARRTTKEKIDEVARGRVWTGDQALQRGLVDRLGSLDDALAAARARAKLSADARVAYLEPEGGRLQRLLDWFGLQGLARLMLEPVIGAAAGPIAPAGVGVVAAPFAAQAEELRWLLETIGRQQPFAVVAHCLCRPGD